MALDIYGTLVDPLEMDEHLEEFAGNRASDVSALWRQKQLEYTFRRGLMGSYEDFGVVSAQALEYASEYFHLDLDEEQQAALLSEYQNLRAFADVVPGLDSFRKAGFHIVAFSNGFEKTTRELLANAGVIGSLEDVISVDDVRTFKPAPAVYEHLCRKLDLPAERVCLVSSNPFDVIGARNFGLKAAWIQRRRDTVFDPWGVSPDFVAGDLEDLASMLTSTDSTR